MILLLRPGIADVAKRADVPPLESSTYFYRALETEIHIVH
jgi:hypothetical protein